MKIYTSYYGKIKALDAAGIVPISISVKPPFWFKGKHIKRLCPRVDMLKGMSKEEYEHHFTAILESIDLHSLGQEMRLLADGKPIALLCFESLKTEGEWCHRTMVAEFLNKRYPELNIVEWVDPNQVEKPKPKPKKQDDQPTLF